MHPVRSDVDPDALAAELADIPLEPNAYRINVALPLAAGIPGWASRPLISVALSEVAEITGREPTHLMLNELTAGNVIPIHTDREDAGKQGERWHLPLTTNPLCFWWDCDLEGEVHQSLGFWWGPCPNRIPHRVGNRGDTDRLHLIVDLA